MAKGVATLDIFHCAALICGNSHWIFVTVVSLPKAKRQAVLFQVVDAVDALSLSLGRGQRRQEHGRQNGNDGNDDEQSNQGETWFCKMPGCGVHARNYDLPAAGFKSFFSEADMVSRFGIFFCFTFFQKLFGLGRFRVTSMQTYFSP
jgi:hypothetical protein